jgi:hypothetical protein
MAQFLLHTASASIVTNGTVLGSSLVVHDGPHRVISTGTLPDLAFRLPIVVAPTIVYRGPDIPLERGKSTASST